MTQILLQKYKYLFGIYFCKSSSSYLLVIQLREHIKMYSIAGSEYKDLFERTPGGWKKTQKQKKTWG